LLARLNQRTVNGKDFIQSRVGGDHSARRSRSSGWSAMNRSAACRNGDPERPSCRFR
jgi:hypothetical protein